MTSPSPTLPPLTAAELQQQQRRRLQLYGGLSEDLRVAVRVRDATALLSAACPSVFVLLIRLAGQ
jgi:hypothetical protein